MTNRATDKIDQGDIKPLNKEIKKNSIKQINWFRMNGLIDRSIGIVLIVVDWL